MKTNITVAATRRPRVFISYKRNADPDVSVVERVVESLTDHCDVYIDKDIPIGVHWGGWIKDSIRGSDYFIAFMTESSLQSKMVEEEVRLASTFAQEQNGKPQILPVKLGRQVSLDHVSYELGSILKPIQWAEWTDHADTPELIAKLLGALDGHALPLDSGALKVIPPTAAQPSFSAPALSGKSICWKEGIVTRDSKFYVERAADQVALEAISQEEGETVTIQGPQKIGKSSLLARTMHRAENLGLRRVWIDFELFEKKVLADPRLFYKQFCRRITQELQDDEDLDFLEDNVAQHWARSDSDVLLCSSYVTRNILKPLGKTEKSSLLLALDRVDRLAECDFSADFFGMLRSWHNERSIYPLWNKLHLFLAISTEPLQLINNMNTSPFNVGQRVELDDFTPAQVAMLNEQYGSPFNPGELNQLIDLLGGQPYLTRRALYLVASRQITVADLYAKAIEDRGPFSDYLRFYLVRLHGQEDLIRGLREIIHDGRCENEPLAYRLRGIGLIKKSGRREWMRCKLYNDFFQEHL